MISLPILLPFFLIILLLIGRKNGVFQKITGIIGSFALLFIAIAILLTVKKEGVLVSQAGNWPAPFGISLVIDLFSAIMLFMTAIVSIFTAIYASGSMELEGKHAGFYLFFYGMVMGVNGAFTTGDLFNLYVWFEVFLMASFALIVLGNDKRQYEGGLTYLTINLLSSLLFLSGIGLLYGHTGTLNLADLSIKFNSEELDTVKKMSLGLFFVAFAIKSALFPFFFWLPSSYPAPPPAIMGFFAGLLTKVGVYAMIRLYTLFFYSGNEFWNTLLMVIAGFTMLFGAIAATTQNDMRKILSFSIVSQMGYLIMGLGFFTPMALAGTIYYMAHNILLKTNLFFIVGIIGREEGSYDLKKIKDWLYRSPILALIFFISAAALGGIPPLSGFAGKFQLVLAGFEEKLYFPGALILVVSIFSLLYMLRIWNHVFWGTSAPLPKKRTKIKLSLLVPVGGLTLLIIALGMGAAYFMELAVRAAEQLVDPTNYIRAVLYP